MTTSDIIIIGAGPGGYETAVEAAANGLSTTIIEAAMPGGTCLNEGCIPTKTLCKSAEVADTLADAANLGFEVSYSANWNRVMERKSEVVGKLVSGVEFLLRNKLITYVKGTARFVDAHTVAVGDETYSAPNIVIATGSVTKYLPIEGLHLPGVITSREILNIDHIPEKMVIIGGGVIGLEFASIFRSFGTEITVVEYAKEILPNFDTDISKRLKAALKARGIEIINSAAVTGVSEGAEGLEVHYQLKGADKSVSAPLVLLAVGRAANVGSLNLAEVGIEFSPRGITTNEFMETNVAGVYAIGDVNGRCMLAHAAVAQGKVALHHIMGDDDKSAGIRLDIMPAAVFTHPEAATVGLSEDQCKAQGIEYAAKKSMYGGNGKALSMNEPTGICKLIIDASSRRILGCHILGAHAADIVQEATALINCNATIDTMLDTIHPHPTLSEVLMEAAKAF